VAHCGLDVKKGGWPGIWKDGLTGEVAVDDSPGWDIGVAGWAWPRCMVPVAWEDNEEGERGDIVGGDWCDGITWTRASGSTK
jgi:hypothetical protein